MCTGLFLYLQEERTPLGFGGGVQHGPRWATPSVALLCAPLWPMRPMAVGPLVRSLWWAQPADAGWARVVRAEARAPVCGRHSGAAYVFDFCKNLV